MTHAPTPPHQQALHDLGWDAFFSDQTTDDDAGMVPMRLMVVQRTKMRGHDGTDQHELFYPGSITSAEVAVGDWVMVDMDALRITRVLDRHSLLKRRAAGVDLRAQFVAANVDTLFVVTSCNADFNEARLERFIAMALEAGTSPVVVITKADLVTPNEAAAFKDRAARLAPDQTVLTLDAHSGAARAQLATFCGTAKTVALLGSSGVGKSTLTNLLTGSAQAIAGIREDDAKGRHTTTSRSLHAIPGGGWLIDTPGMREFGLFDAAGGIDLVFADLLAIEQTCKFRNCAHQSEPGCAIRAGIDAGTIDADRLTRWRKLRDEDAGVQDQLVQNKKAAERATSGPKGRTTRPAKRPRQRSFDNDGE